MIPDFPNSPNDLQQRLDRAVPPGTRRLPPTKDDDPLVEDLENEDALLEGAAADDNELDDDLLEDDTDDNVSLDDLADVPGDEEEV